MTNNENPRLKAHAQENEPVLSIRMLLIEELSSHFIEKHGFSLAKGYSMLLQIRLGLSLVPLEIYHMYIVCTKRPVSVH